MKFLETIAIVNGTVRNASYHRQRMNYSAGIDSIDLDEILHTTASDLDPGTYYKLRIEYDEEGVISSDLSPYSYRHIDMLMLREASPELDYSKKYADRSALDVYSKDLPIGSIPLIVKDHFITDTSYTNVCFRKKDGSWVTPSTPLLKGTMRQSFLDKGIIREMDIKVDDLNQFEEVALINAMMPLGEMVLPIASVNFGIFDAGN